MGYIFFWMQTPPGKVYSTKWEAFLDNMAAASLGMIVVAIILIAVWYMGAAKSKRIFQPADVFSPYTPLYSVPISAFIVALLVFGYCAWQYPDLLGNDAPGQWGVAAQIAGFTMVCAFVLGYLVTLIPGITPPKFKYRPRWFLHGRKG